MRQVVVGVLLAAVGLCPAVARPQDDVVQLESALAEPLPRDELGVSAAADYLESGRDDASRLTFEARGAKRHFDLEVGIAVFGQKTDPVVTAFASLGPGE